MLPKYDLSEECVIEDMDYSNIIDLNEYQSSGGDFIDIVNGDSVLRNVQVLNDISQLRYSDLANMQIENASIEEINVENIENINFENICVENIRCVDNVKYFDGACTPAKGENWVYLESDGDLQKTVASLLHSDAKGQAVEVQYIIPILQQRNETDFLNPVSKEQIVEECGLLNKNDDMTPSYSIGGVSLNICNDNTIIHDSLFEEDFKLHLQSLEENSSLHTSY